VTPQIYLLDPDDLSQLEFLVDLGIRDQDLAAATNLQGGPAPHIQAKVRNFKEYLL
jgi:hypothetical protein